MYDDDEEEDIASKTTIDGETWLRKWLHNEIRQEVADEI